MNEHIPQEFPRDPDVRTFQYDVLLMNLREQDPELFEQLLVAAEAESLSVEEKEQFIQGFLYSFGIQSENERTALLERIFAMPDAEVIDDDGDGDLRRLDEPGGDLPAA